MQLLTDDFDAWLKTLDRKGCDSNKILSLEREDCRSSIRIARQARQQVSFESKVEVREYQVVQGDANCKLPISLDWDVSATTEWDLSERQDRQSGYKSCRRLSLEERRARLYGDVQDNLADFAQTDNSLDELMKGLDDLLSEATLSDFPVLLTPSQPVFSLPPMPQHDFCAAPMPKSLMAYEEFFSTPELPELEAPVVHWRRVARVPVATRAC